MATFSNLPPPEGVLTEPRYRSFACVVRVRTLLSRQVQDRTILAVNNNTGGRMPCSPECVEKANTRWLAFSHCIPYSRIYSAPIRAIGAHQVHQAAAFGCCSAVLERRLHVFVTVHHGNKSHRTLFTLDDTSCTFRCVTNGTIASYNIPLWYPCTGFEAGCPVYKTANSKLRNFGGPLREHLDRLLPFLNTIIQMQTSRVTHSHDS